MNHQLIEQELALLAESITPTQLHRSRILDDATQESRGERIKRHWSRVVIGCSLVLFCGPLLGSMIEVDLPRPRRAQAVESAALEHATQTQTSYDWALVEVFKRQSATDPW
ncbi:MAG: hypothetical protein AAFX06_05790 [Planctomycetota bacterium]